MKHRLLIDVDEVLANFATPAMKVIEQVLGRPWSLAEAPQDQWDMFGGLTPEQLQEVDTIIDAPGWCLQLEPYPGSQEAVERLRKLCDVYVVTSPRRKGRQWVYERNTWLGQHFGFDKDEIIQTSAKFVCSGDFFLDDHPGHVQKWREENPFDVGMLWSTEHNQRLKGYEDMRVHSWDEVVNVVTNIVGIGQGPLLE